MLFSLLLSGGIIASAHGGVRRRTDMYGHESENPMANKFGHRGENPMSDRTGIMRWLKQMKAKTMENLNEDMATKLFDSIMMPESNDFDEFVDTSNFLGKDGHGQKEVDTSEFLGKDGHGQQHEVDTSSFLGKDGHGQRQELDTSEFLGKDGHGQRQEVDTSSFLGKDGHGQRQEVDTSTFLGKDGHGQRQEVDTSSFLGKDGHASTFLGQDGHGQRQMYPVDNVVEEVDSSNFLGQDGHGQRQMYPVDNVEVEEVDSSNFLGKDGHGQRMDSSEFLGKDGHGQRQIDSQRMDMINFLGKDGHGQRQLDSSEFLGKDGHGQRQMESSDFLGKDGHGQRKMFGTTKGRFAKIKEMLKQWFGLSAGDGNDINGTSMHIVVDEEGMDDLFMMPDANKYNEELLPTNDAWKKDLKKQSKYTEQETFGGDEDMEPHGMLGGDEHDVEPHGEGMLGEDGHDEQPNGERNLGGDGHDRRHHGRHGKRGKWRHGDRDGDGKKKPCPPGEKRGRHGDSDEFGEFEVDSWESSEEYSWDESSEDGAMSWMFDSNGEIKPCALKVIGVTLIVFAVIACCCLRYFAIKRSHKRRRPSDRQLQRGALAYNMNKVVGEEDDEPRGSVIFETVAVKGPEGDPTTGGDVVIPTRPRRNSNTQIVV